MKKEMKDVPTEVWQAVRAKWIYALKAGWYNDLWSRCDLCKFMGRDIECSDCPLYADSWCRGKRTTSRMNIRHHMYKIVKSKLVRGTPLCIVKLVNIVHCILYDRMMFRGEVNDSWRSDIVEFLEYIEPYCGLEH